VFFLLSGEGPTDIGDCGAPAAVCVMPAFAPGPMCVIIDQVVEAMFSYSIVDSDACGCVSKRVLAERASEFKAARKSLGLPGAKTRKETRYYFNNARVLARIAAEHQAAGKTPVIPILFRDHDGTASAGRGVWAHKWQSMLDGFAEERCERGVPMIPNPKSEAWLLCGMKPEPYQNCEALEEASGNDASHNSLKKQLGDAIGDAGREDLVELVRNRRVDIGRIVMPSFQKFRARLEQVLTSIGGQTNGDAIDSNSTEA
jgi:hypothetical protein